MPRPVHFEIHADDPQRAAAFYRSVFDWEIEKWEGPQEYWLVATGPEGTPGINGGLMRRMGGSGDAVIAYVCTVDVPSVYDHVERVTAAGGSVVMPRMAIPGIGWHAYCKDTEGNLFGIIENDPEAS